MLVHVYKWVFRWLFSRWSRPLVAKEMDTHCSDTRSVAGEKPETFSTLTCAILQASQTWRTYVGISEGD